MRLFRPPRGTRDFLPDEVAKRRYVEEAIRGIFESYGYREVVTPIFEHFELYAVRSGEKIREEMYVFRGKERERGKPPEYVLRPELTAPICRLYVSKGLMTWPKPIKLYYIGRCFRYDRPGPGRYREFWHAGVELIGSSRPEADAEVIALATKTLEKLGLKEIKVRIGHLGILRSILEAYGITVEKQNRLIGALDKVASDLSKIKSGEAVVNGSGKLLTEREIMENFERTLDEIGVTGQLREMISKLTQLKGPRKEVIEKAKEMFRDVPKAIKALEELNAILDFVEAHNVKNYVVDLSIARGLDYYTGMVFEIEYPPLKAQKQICGGGRYDELISDYGGPKTPATGFALGFDRIVEALKIQGVKIPNVKPTQVMVIPVNENLRKKAVEIAQKIRENEIITEVELMGRNLTNSLAHADRTNIKYTIIIGEEEIKEEKIILRDMEKKTQETLTVEEAIEKIKAGKRHSD